MSLSPGDYRNRRKVTTKAFIAAYATPTTLVNFGNCLSSKQADNIDAVEQITAQKGYLQTTHEEPGKIALREELEFDEMTAKLLGLIHLSAAPGTVSQSSASGTTWAFNTTATLPAAATQGMSYYVGARGLSAFVVTGKTLGADYTIDLGSGMLFIGGGGNIATGSAPAGTFTKAALTYSRFTALGEMSYRAYVRLEYYDQSTTVPREVKEGYALVRVTDRGEFKGDGYTKVKVGILWTATPQIDSAELS